MHTVNNANSFLTKIKGHKLEADEMMISFDVVSLFTSIPLDTAKQITNDLLTNDCSWQTKTGHTSKPGPDSDLDSDPKKTRTQQKPGLVLGLAFKKPGLDNRKPGLQIENTGFDETGF